MLNNIKTLATSLVWKTVASPMIIFYFYLTLTFVTYKYITNNLANRIIVNKNKKITSKYSIANFS